MDSGARALSGASRNDGSDCRRVENARKPCFDLTAYAAAPARSLWRWILPVAVRGSSAASV